MQYNMVVYTRGYSYSREISLQGGSVSAESEDDILQTLTYRCTCIFKHVGVIGLQSYRIWWNNAKQGRLRPSRSFKVTYVGINGKPICDLLL